jgi:hypothetical protein
MMHIISANAMSTFSFENVSMTSYLYKNIVYVVNYFHGILTYGNIRSI